MNSSTTAEALVDNPFEMAAVVLDEYRRNVMHSLQQSGVSAADIERIRENLRLDRGLIISLQPEYLLSQTRYRDFCRENSVARAIEDVLAPRLLDGRLYQHQEEAIKSILADRDTIIATGTGSGKTESFLIPILSHCAAGNALKGIKALLIYPMNALANDQVARLAEYVRGTDITYGILTGSTPDNAPRDDSEKFKSNERRSRSEILLAPPDILLTNHIMLERLLTIPKWEGLLKTWQTSLKYIVVDELHTFRGSNAAHLMLLLRRLKATLARRPVQIGASATLGTGTGVFSETTLDRSTLDDFLKKILSSDTVHLVTPKQNPVPDLPVSEAAAVAQVDVLPSDILRLDIEGQARLLSGLSGQKISTRELTTKPDIRDTSAFKTIDVHPFILRIKRNLRYGCMSLDRIVGLCQETYPGTSYTESEKFVRAWLAAINIINLRCPGRPFLDLRIHLFLREISGVLFKCLMCLEYHPGGGEVCPVCGGPLFPVKKDDVTACLGKLVKHRLVPSLIRSRQDGNSAVFVIIRREFPETAHSTQAGTGQRFRHDGHQVDQDGTVSICITPHVDGELLLEFHPAQDPESLDSASARLSEDANPREHLRALFASIFRHVPVREQKLLSFVDDREKASRESGILRDDLASAFLEGYLKHIYPETPPYPTLTETMEIMESRVSERFQAKSEMALVPEMAVWFRRYVGRVNRGSIYERLLHAVDGTSLTEQESKVLSVFLRERAIDFKCDDAPTHFIKYQKHWACVPRRIYCRPQDAPERRKSFAAISLSAQADEYADLILEFGQTIIAEEARADEDEAVVKQAGAATILKIVEELVAKGYLTRHEDGEQRTYSLRPEKVTLDPRIISSAASSLSAVSRERLLVAEMHSSELQPDNRRKVENAFRAGEINLLICTPTLEMGIDIGGLDHVAMLGVPPISSSYAQRSGRAGRRGRSAFILCLCSDERPHDQYYFRHPEAMIDGVINPPSFNQPGASVYKKHLHALLLAGKLEEAILRKVSIDGAADALHVRDVLGESAEFAIDEYLNKDFPVELERQVSLSRSEGIKPYRLMYENGFLPDYGFQRDSVRVWDREDSKGMRRSVAFGGRDDGCIAERDAQMALRKFAPGRIGYLAGEVYEFSADGVFDVWPVDDIIFSRVDQDVRTYRRVVANRITSYVSGDDERYRYDMETLFLSEQKGKDMGGIASVSYDPNCSLIFMNHGEKNLDGVVPFLAPGDLPFQLGYRTTRKALLFRFDNRIMATPIIPLSFLSAIDRVLKDHFKLDEGEIQLLSDLTPIASTIPGERSTWFALYDATGNGDPPLDAAFRELESLMRMAADKLKSCPHCSNGCYYCLKSYFTQYTAPLATKQAALNMLGYLLGETPFVPDVSRYENVDEMPTAVVVVRWKGAGLHVTVDSNVPKVISVNKRDSASLYEALASFLGELPIAASVLEIHSNIDHLHKALSGAYRARSGRDAFAHLQYVLARYLAVRSVRLT